MTDTSPIPKSGSPDIQSSASDSSYGDLLTYHDGVYNTADGKATMLGKMFPTASFYRQFGWNVLCSSRVARRGQYDSEAWSRSSFRVLQSLESVGVKIECTGVDNIRQLETPCVFVGNHMSMFETIILPSIIQPIRDVTYVVKKSLLEYPVFRHIARARNPIAVSRDNPRDDFKTVMTSGVEKLDKGVSIIVFPQTTRALTIEASEFNTIGIKLALRAGVPVIPVALQTDAWGNGKWIKDIGAIDPSRPVRIAFGSPVTPSGRGAEQHRQVIEFIQSNLSDWAAN